MRFVPVLGFEGKLDDLAKPLLNKIAGDVADDARRSAPVKTGRLRGSIRVEENKVYADAEYAAFVELGTGRSSAQPYLRPALYKQRG